MNELEIIWKEAFVVYFFVPSCSFHGRAWKMTKILSGWLVWGLRCELRNSWIQNEYTWGVKSSGLWHHVTGWVAPDISEKSWWLSSSRVSSVRRQLDTAHRCNTILWNITNYTTYGIVLHPRSLESLATQPREPQILQKHDTFDHSVLYWGPVAWNAWYWGNSSTDRIREVLK